MANDMLRTRKIGEYHIETDRKGGYIEFAQGKYIELSVAKHIDNGILAFVSTNAVLLRKIDKS